MLPERPSACHAFFCQEIRSPAVAELKFRFAKSRLEGAQPSLAVGRAGILPAVAQETTGSPQRVRPVADKMPVGHTGSPERVRPTADWKPVPPPTHGARWLEGSSSQSERDIQSRDRGIEFLLCL